MAAVLEAGTDEPLLVACAAVEARGHPFRFAPGLFEIAEVVGGLRLRHVCALGGEFCRLVSGDLALVEAGAPVPDTAVVRLPVRGLAESWVEADAAAVEAVRALFARTDLTLEQLDAEPCARLSLHAFLGADPAELGSVDPLAAVSVLPGCERAAAELAERLAVPVGLALARFAWSEPDAHR